MSTKFFRQNDWKNIVEHIQTEDRVIIREYLSTSCFETLEVERSIVLCLPKTTERVAFDGFKWSKTENGKRIQPFYRSCALNGVKYQTIHCTEANNTSFKKDILHYRDKSFIHYFLEDGGTFRLPDAKNLEKKRIGGSISEDLKLNILPHRSTSAAYAIASQKGYSVSRKQINNIRRGITDVVSGRSGRRVVTNMNDIEELAKKFPNDLQYFLDQNHELVFGFVSLFEDGLKVYAAGCPKKTAYEEWQNFVNDLKSKPAHVQKEKLNQVLEDNSSGLMFPSRIYVDTTFNLSDCYVTFVLGETSNFRSKSSTKPRVVPLGYLIHSHKHEQYHAFFADKLETAMRSFMVEKSVPAVLMDGEKALQRYAEALSANVLRCDWHIMRGLSLKSNQKAAKKATRFLYGYKDDSSKWKCGLFGCFSIEQFERRLQKLEFLVDPKIYQWLMKNKSWLFETASSLAKLRGGLVLQHSTNNPSENFNKQLKEVFQKPLSASVLIEKLDNFSKEKLRELRKAAVGDSEFVILEKNIDQMDFVERKTHFKEIGLMATSLLSYDTPRELLRHLDLNRCDIEEKYSESIRLLSTAGSSFVMENTSLGTNDPNRVTIIARNLDILECSVCKNTLPIFICRHLLSCLESMDELDRKIELWRLEDKVKGSTAVTVPVRSGKKPSDRMGGRSSAYNHIRVINDVSDMTVFRNDGPIDEENSSMDFSDASDSSQELNFSLNESSSQRQMSVAGISMESRSEISFSPNLMSTRLENECSTSSRRVRKTPARYSPNPSTSDIFNNF